MHHKIDVQIDYDPEWDDYTMSAFCRECSFSVDPMSFDDYDNAAASGNLIICPNNDEVE